MAQINGKQQTNLVGVTPLEKILNRRVFSSTYFTDNFTDYSKWLTHQNLIDLHRHSLDVLGEMTKGDRTKTILKLETAFKKYHSNIKSLEAYNNRPKETPSSGPKTIEEILEQARK